MKQYADTEDHVIWLLQELVKSSNELADGMRTVPVWWMRDVCRADAWLHDRGYATFIQKDKKMENPP